MALEISGILKDSLVQQTIAALQGQYRAAPEQHDLDQHPVLKLLEKTGALDSVTAAVMVADEMARGGDVAGALPLLPPAVGEVLRLLHAPGSRNSDPMDVITLLVEDGNPAALKIAMAVLAYSGREFDVMQRQMGKEEKAKAARDFADSAIEALTALAENKRWQAATPELLKAFTEAAENFGKLVDGNARKRLLTASLEALRDALAQDGIDLRLAAAAAPAPKTPFNPSLRLGDVLNDPLVQETIAAIGSQPGSRDIFGNPALAALADADTLDSVTAAALIAVGARADSRGLPRPVREAVEILSSPAVAYLGPLAMFESDNPAVHKIGLASVAAGLSGRELQRAQNDLSGRRFREEMTEVIEASLMMIDRVIESGTWKDMSPKLIDRFTDGLQNLKPLAGGKTRQRLIDISVQALKAEVAKGAAAEITGPQQGTSGPGATVVPAAEKKKPPPRLKL